MGSVKDITIIQEAQQDREGIGRFVFSDRYSVFDWGEMPDHIFQKGKAICITTAYFFEKLEKKGIKTHYSGVVEDGKAKKLDELKEAQNVMEFKLLRVIKPIALNDKYDYSVYKNEKSNFLLPLEIIYRNSLPEGSSVFKRLKEGSLKLSDIGLEEIPAPGHVLDKPIIDLSTKLEATDRYINWDEAKAMCGLSDKELQDIKQITLSVNENITSETERLGLFNEDGKLEFGFDTQRNLVVVDAIGTLDECRFTYNGIPVSKEIARIYYRRTNWYQDIEKAKNQDRINWKERVKGFPPPLPKELARAISLLYAAYANELTGRSWFDAPSLKEVLKTIKGLL